MFDFLFIDSRHEPVHLCEELRAHAPNVGKFILVHDTSAVPALYKELERFTNESRWKIGGWVIEQHETRNVGFTLLKRL